MNFSNIFKFGLIKLYVYKFIFRKPMEVQENRYSHTLKHSNLNVKRLTAIKQYLFNFFYQFLDYQKNGCDRHHSSSREYKDDSMTYLVFITGVQFLQLFVFPFHAILVQSWNRGKTQLYFSELIQKVRLESYLPWISFDEFVIIFYSLNAMLALIIAVIFSVGCSSKNLQFTWPIRIVLRLFLPLVTILFLPVIEVFLSVMKCQIKESADSQVMEFFPSKTCWEGQHLFHSVIALLGYSTFVIMSLIATIVLFEPRMKSHELFARKNTRGEISIIFTKIICQVIFSFRVFSSTVIYTFLLLVLSSWIYWEYYMNSPFHDKKVAKLYKILSASYLWTNFLLLSSEILRSIEFTGSFIIWMSGLPFIAFIIGFQTEINLNFGLNFSGRFRSAVQIQRHLYSLLQLLEIKESDKKAFMLILRYIEQHQQVCQEDDCSLKVSLKSKGKMGVIKTSEITMRLLKEIQKIFKVGIKKYPLCNQLQISFAFFNLEWTKNNNVAYQIFNSLLRQNPTFQQEFIIKRFQKMIRENLQQNKDNLDISKLMKFEKHIPLLEKEMVLSARFHREFFIQLEESVPNLNKLSQLGIKITMGVQRIRQNFYEIIETQILKSEVLYAYATYLILVANDEKQGNQLMQLYKNSLWNKKEVPINKQDIQLSDQSFPEGTIPIIIVSMKNSSLCQIIFINSLFSELTGYNREELVDQNLEKILPEVLTTTHQKNIQSLLRSSQKVNSIDYFNSSHDGYIKTKSGHIMPIKYSVKYEPKIEKSFILFRARQDISMNTCHLVIDGWGVIRDISRMGSYFFGFEKKDLLKEEHNIKQIGMKDIDWEQQSVGKFSLVQELTFYNKQKYQCRIFIDQIKLKSRQYEIEESCHDQSESMMTSKQTIIGYNVQIICVNFTGHITKQLGAIPDKERSDAKDQNSDILFQLYKTPNIQDLSVKKKGTPIKKFEPFILTTKIKELRYFNNQLRVISHQQNLEQRQQKSDNGPELQAEEDYLRFNDQKYQQKIRRAISTDIKHTQIQRLKIMVILVILVLIGSNIVCFLHIMGEYKDISQQTEQFLNKTKLSIDLYRFLWPTTSQAVDSVALFEQISQYQINYQSDEKIDFTTIQGNKIEKVFTDVLRYGLSNLTVFYALSSQKLVNQIEQEGRHELLNNIYGNYIEKIYPFLRQRQLEKIKTFIQPSEFIRNSLSTFFCVFSPLFLFYCFWVYTNIKINHKREQIIFWFLDIPTSYISCLHENYDYYLENQMSIREMSEKDINIRSKQMQKQTEQCIEKEKYRKRIVTRHKSKNIYSVLSLRSLKMGWMALYGLGFWVIAIIYLSNFREIMEFYYMPYQKTSEQILKSNHLVLSSSLQQFTDYPKSQLIEEQKENAKDLFINYITDSAILEFNLNSINKHAHPALTFAIDNYNTALFSDICNYLSQPQEGKCSKIAGSSLKGSFRTFSMFLIDPLNYKNPQKLTELKVATSEYTSAALFRVLKLWNNLINEKIKQGESVIFTAFYVFIFLGMIILAVIWEIYLIKKNDEINWSIKMLNMMPLKFLPKSRKQTKDFIAELIEETNKEIYKNDD